jgi:ribonucleoside-diphosphate reductase alpha chain
MIKQIQKRDGRIVDFDKNKITEAIWKAAKSVGGKDRRLAEKIAEEVLIFLENHCKKNDIEVPSVEQVQDCVEKTLIEKGHAKTAKCYILYREKRSELRRAKALIGVEDDSKLPLNSLIVLSSRYLKKDENLKIVETPKQLFRRVARAIASVDKLYGKGDEEIEKIEEEFYNMLLNLEFLPNSPTLMNADTEIGQLSACFVLPVEDSIESIYDAIKAMALVHKTGGGTGFSFSRLRPNGDVVKKTGGIASGPLSFMRAFDVNTDVIKQGGKRRGANMGILSVDHPDILDFIVSKEREGVLDNFNISVALTDKFMDAILRDKEIELINPRNKRPIKKLKARVIWNLILTLAWRNGEPGIIFIDTINKNNPTLHIGRIESTNPCGEQPLLPYESCNLGSINLSKMIIDDQIDWDKLKNTVRKAVHFLDNVIDVNNYPLVEIEKMTKANRKIGLGIMGFADMLIQLGIPYNTEDGIRTAEEVMKFITQEARKMSVGLGRERGSFPNFKGSVWEQKFDAMRNATVTTIAPTGSIGVIANSSSGIEPLFAISYTRNVGETIGTDLIEVNPLFEKIAIKEGFYSEDLMKKISKKASIQHIEEIPENIRKIFVTAHNVSPEWHIRMQAAFQKYTDNAVSKTVNFSYDATPQDIEKVYWLAYKLGCKGVTVYRDGSRKRQVLTTEESINPKKSIVDLEITADPEYSGGCPTCHI